MKAKNVYFFYLGFYEVHKFKGNSNKVIKVTVNEIIVEQSIFKLKLNRNIKALLWGVTVLVGIA